MVIRQEPDAFIETPKLLFDPTLDQCRAVFERGISPYPLNSLFDTVISCALVLPAAAAIAPIFVAAQQLRLIDNAWCWCCCSPR